MGHPREFQSSHQSLVRALRLRDRLNAFHIDVEKAFCPSAPLGRRISETRTNQPLLFQAVQSRVQRATTWVTTRARCDLLPDRHAVGLVAETKDGKQNDLLEVTEGRDYGHKTT